MRAWMWLLLAAMLVTIPGCGGCSTTSSMAELRRRAIVRDDEEDTAVTVAEPPPPGPGESEDASPTPPGDAQPTPPAVAVEPTTPDPSPTKPAVEPSTAPGPAPAVAPVASIDPPSTAQAVEHLTKIAAALEAYLQDKGQYPRLGNYIEDHPTPLLSWRVEILPYLGYEELYRKFNIYQPWDAPVNKKLLAEIPPEYQSLGATDARTNYIAIVGPDSAFVAADQARQPRHFTDGLTNSVLVVEADDERAVPWTAPTDAPYRANGARAGLFARRADGVLAIIGGGQVRRIAPQATQEDLAAMFTISKAEAFDAVKLLLPVGGTPPPMIVDAGDPAALTPTSPPTKERLPPITDRPAVETRRPIPDALAQRTGKKILAELYKDEYDRARTPQQKHELVAKLLAKSEEIQADAVGYYLILNLAQEIAQSTGDVPSTLQAIDGITTHYQVDGVALQSKAIETLAKSLSSEAAAKSLLAECVKVINEALAKDEFELAERALESATTIAKRIDQQRDIQQLAEVKKIIDEAKQAYAQVPAARSTLAADPDNAEANTLVGRYLCLYRRDWPLGLAHLTRGGDIKLKFLAQIDLSNPTKPEQQADLGDQWYALGADARPYAQQAFAIRAGHWYALALEGLPSGLVKSRVQKRLQDIADQTGDASLEDFAAQKRRLPVDE